MVLFVLQVLLMHETDAAVDEQAHAAYEQRHAQGDAGALKVNTDNVTIQAADEPLEITLVKNDEAGEPLAGATFTIEPAAGTFPDGEASKTYTSADDGVVFDALQVTGSAEGTCYTVTEIAPATGYEALPAFDVLVFDDGTVKPFFLPTALGMGQFTLEGHRLPSGDYGQIDD